MNWDDTRIFLSVARNGQILAAAQRLGINHATVARRVTALEDALQTKLLERATTGCSLTAEGERFLEYAEVMEAQMQDAQAIIGGMDVELSGTVRIAAPDGFGVNFLAPRLGEFNEKYPNLTVQLVPLHRSFSLSKREADIAINVGRPEHGRLVTRKLVDYSLNLYASREYIEKYGVPVTSDDLKQHRLIGYVDDLVFTPSLNYTEEILKGWRSSLEFASALAQTEAVRAGAGIGVLHAFIANQDPTFVRVLPERRIERSYWLLTHETTKNLRRIKMLGDFIVESVLAERHLF
ncbi:LysR family transcriptional regulator [Pseudovibrio sp. SPO723]|uniref:LysR family transcriptional regulator n=1 Tax=Nesiotobacter zosterae TaxID=392721 RepID=UPI0029C13C05|nr:LysR family transcriptional regulator [Pseudovibrio sp. SPO723]MDX5593596.1 LysR family transcriptional regulator [Pseudovibrio sp. SPO723]